MAGDLAGRTAIVLDAGTTLGRAVAQRMVEGGARVMLAGANERTLAEAAADIRAENGRIARFRPRRFDKLGAANLIAATLDAFGRMDVLVTMPRTTQPGSFAELDGAAFGEALEENVTTTFVFCQAIAKRMVQAGAEDEGFDGAIVNVSSIAARRTAPELIAYSVACAALDQLTRSMAADLARQRVRVNGVALGAVMNERIREAFREREDLRGEIAAVTPLGRIGEAEEAAEVIAFLASRRASFVTGQVLAVDGGRTILDPFAAPVR